MFRTCFQSPNYAIQKDLHQFFPLLVTKPNQYQTKRITCGLLISFELYYYWQDPGYSNYVQYVLVGCFILFEFLNLMCHITLRRLRTKGGYLRHDDEEAGKSTSIKGIPDVRFKFRVNGNRAGDLDWLPVPIIFGN